MKAGDREKQKSRVCLIKHKKVDKPGNRRNGDLIVVDTECEIGELARRHLALQYKKHFRRDLSRLDKQKNRMIEGRSRGEGYNRKDERKITQQKEKEEQLLEN